MAHLASAAYRIGTIIDKHKAFLINYNYREKLKKTDKVNYESELRINLEQFLPLMLRDLEGHNLRDTHKFACPRKNVIHKLTPSECLKIMGKTVLAIERDLIANQSKIKNRVLPGFNGV